MVLSSEYMLALKKGETTTKTRKTAPALTLQLLYPACDFTKRLLYPAIFNINL